MTMRIVRCLSGLLLTVVITGCITTGSLRSTSNGQVIDDETGEPLSDVQLLITYRSAPGGSVAQECYAATRVTTDAKGYFSVPSLSTLSEAADTAPVIDVRPYKRGYTYISYNQADPVWPVSIDHNSFEAGAAFTGQKQSPPAVRMHKNNMSPKLRWSYVDSLRTGQSACVNGQQEAAAFVSIVGQEAIDLEALGVRPDGVNPTQWYGPGVEGLQRQAAAAKPKRKIKKKVPVTKKASTLTPEQIAEKKAREERRRDRRRKLDEILMKSQ